MSPQQDSSSHPTPNSTHTSYHQLQSWCGCCIVGVCWTRPAHVMSCHVLCVPSQKLCIVLPYLDSSCSKLLFVPELALQLCSRAHVCCVAAVSCDHRQPRILSLLSPTTRLAQPQLPHVCAYRCVTCVPHPTARLQTFLAVSCCRWVWFSCHTDKWLPGCVLSRLCCWRPVGNCSMHRCMLSCACMEVCRK